MIECSWFKLGLPITTVGGRLLLQLRALDDKRRKCQIGEHFMRWILQVCELFSYRYQNLYTGKSGECHHDAV